MGWDAHRLELNPKGAIIAQIRIILYALATGSVWQAPHKPQRAFEKIRGLLCAATQPDKCKEIAETRIEKPALRMMECSKQRLQRTSLARLQPTHIFCF